MAVLVEHDCLLRAVLYASESELAVALGLDTLRRKLVSLTP